MNSRCGKTQAEIIALFDENQRIKRANIRYRFKEWADKANSGVGFNGNDIGVLLIQIEELQHSLSLLEAKLQSYEIAEELVS